MIAMAPILRSFLGKTCMSVELRSFIFVRLLFLSYWSENASLYCFLMELESFTGSICAEGEELVL